MIKNFYKIFILVTPLLLTYCSSSHKETEVRHIVPPKLEDKYLGKKILCYRPMRHGTPAMNVEIKKEKYIINNYGHGGSGWTLAPGSAIHVVNLLEKQAAKDLDKNSEIVVLGAGVIGLFTAYELSNRGYEKITVVADQTENLTSHNAGGLVAPVSMSNSPEMQSIVSKIGFDAYRFYEKVAKSQHQDFQNGAVIVPTYFETREESGLEPYVGVVMQPAKDVVLDFGNGTQRKMVAYDDGIFVDTAIFMSSLRKILLKRNVTFKNKHIQSFAELREKYIFNCTGGFAKALTHDNELVSVQGHLVMLKDQHPNDMNYMILVYLPEKTQTPGFKGKRSVYMFPKRLANSSSCDVGVIGGTFIEGATPATPHLEEFNVMIANARKFYGLS